MKLLINSYNKNDHEGYFLSGQVLYESIVTNQEALDIPDSLTVNLSKSGHNPQCDTPLKWLQGHNGHAGTFFSRTVMREYIRRVTADVVDVVDKYNMALEELQSDDNQLTHATVEHNEDLAPLPVVLVPMPTTGMMLFDMSDPAALQEIHDALFGDSEELEELDFEEDED
jgi:hypothetical protein